MKMAAFCDVALCSLVETGWRFGGAYCLHQQGYHSEDSHHQAVKAPKNKYGVLVDDINNYLRIITMNNLK
jgi:hypothetical protein